MAYNYKGAAKGLLKESLEFSLRPKKGDRVGFLIHAFDFLFREYAEETSEGQHVVNSQHVSCLIRELRELENSGVRD